MLTKTLPNYFLDISYIFANEQIHFLHGARKVTGDNLKVVWAEFSTLSLAVLQNVYNPWPVQTRLSLDLKTRSRFRSVSLSLPMFSI